jgi:hypothetical protein
MRSRFIITMVLSLTLLVVFALPVQAAGTNLSVSSASGALGQQVDIVVSIENPSGLAGGAFNLYYDPDTLEPTEIIAGEVLKNLMLETNLNYQGSQGKAVRAVWAGTRGVQNGGLLCRISFKLLQDGTSPLNLGEIELFDSDLNPISAAISNGNLVAGTGEKPVTPPASDSTTQPDNSPGQNPNNNSGKSGSQAPANGSNEIPPFTGGSQAQTGQNKNNQEQQKSQQQNPWQRPEQLPGQAVIQPPTTGNTVQPGSGNKNSFSDTARHWACTYIEQMAQKRIMSGYPNGSFQPDKNITRAEFAQVIAVAMNLPLNEQARLSFSDQKNIPDWARVAIAAAQKAGIINGYEDGSFGPHKNITRAEMAVMIAKANKAQIDQGASLDFSDAARVPEWARPYVAAAVKAGIISGRDNNTFDPLSSATRAEAACMIAKML